MTEYEQRQIAEAIARAERTDAELVTVLARRADDYYLPLLWAACWRWWCPAAAPLAGRLASTACCWRRC
jgi:putative membrane protein